MCEHEWVSGTARSKELNRFCVLCGQLIVDSKIIWKGFSDPCLAEKSTTASLPQQSQS
jgi:hypothetical protein